MNKSQKMATANIRIFGRDNDLVTLSSDLDKDEKTIRLIVGESGVGKSFLLDNFFYRINEKEIHSNQATNNITYFIGYYSKKIPLHPNPYRKNTQFM